MQKINTDAKSPAFTTLLVMFKSKNLFIQNVSLHLLKMISTTLRSARMPQSEYIGICYVNF